MEEDKISVISIECISPDEKQIQFKKDKEKIQKDSEVSPWNICHVISVLAICVASISVITLVPRTNSIFYQSYWYEFNFCILVLMVLTTTDDVFHIATYLKEESIYSFWMPLKIYSLYMVAWVVPYLTAYFVWCHYLNYNWPIPLLGYNYFVFLVVRPAALWISLSHDLCRKENFRKKFKMYIFYYVAIIIFAVLREVMSIFFKVVPGYLQWITAFLIPLLKSSQTFVQSRFVNKMVGGDEEASQVLFGLTVDSFYSIFIAVRLPNAETTTVCFIIAVDLFLLLQMSYKIVQLYNGVIDETSESENNEKDRIVTRLAIAELTEGITPIVYATVITTAYYGFNGNIIGDIKNDFWGYKPIDEIGYLFQMMGLLLGVDVLSSLINGLTLSSLTNVNLFREICRIMMKYWHFIAAKFAAEMFRMFALKDINLGMDSTGKFNWITDDGRISLINGSTELPYEEKYCLIN